MERSTRKSLIGKVTSVRGDKLFLLVKSYRSHNLYSKRYRVVKRFIVHDEKLLATLVTLFLLWKLVHYRKLQLASV